VLHPYPTPIATVTYNAATNMYALSIRFEGHAVHFEMDTFRTLEDLLRWLDPGRDRVWERGEEAELPMV
jgi:hypothetical protein